MTLLKSQADLDFVVQRATEVFGAPARAATLPYDMSSHLLRHARRLPPRGLGGEQPIRQFESGVAGHKLVFGFERYVASVDGRSIPLVRLVDDSNCSPLDDLWLVAARDYLRLYRWLRRAVRRGARGIAPVMRDEDRRQLWDNTIGFLKRGEEALARFGVPLKRGVLLRGEPGNGKTMAARWLNAEAERHRLEWRTVRAEDYDLARARGSAHQLFELYRPGIILFDDFDSGLREDDAGSTRDRSTFLSELDGLEIRSGIVYLFTSNARLTDLDPALRRPGRIDCVIHFPRPDEELRRRLVIELWPCELVAELPLEEVVEVTEGLSFAEIDELKKLLVLHYLDERSWDWPLAWSTFSQRLHESRLQRNIGFACAGAEGEWPARELAS